MQEWRNLTDGGLKDKLPIRVKLTSGREVATYVVRRPSGELGIAGQRLEDVTGWRLRMPTAGATLETLATGELCGLEAGEARAWALFLAGQERARQDVALGYDAAHDDRHRAGELGRAAICHLQSAAGADVKGWPFEAPRFRPGQLPVLDVVKAAALVLAELERLLRLPPQEFGI